MIFQSQLPSNYKLKFWLANFPPIRILDESQEIENRPLTLQIYFFYFNTKFTRPLPF